MSIKCSNCGHVNPLGRLVCERCGQKIPTSQKGAEPAEPSQPFGKTVVGLRGNPPASPPENFGGTLLGHQMLPTEEFGGKTINDFVQPEETLASSKLESSQELPPVGLKTIPRSKLVHTGCSETLLTQCEYFMMVGLDECPRCGIDLLGYRRLHNPDGGEFIDTEPPMVKKPTESTDEDDSYDPYRQPQFPNQRLSFSLVPRSNEDAPITLDGFRSPDVEKMGVKLNRETLEPGNRSISNVLQAQLNFIGGKWVLEDRSIHQTTFLLLREPYELKNGDVVLMGDRKFRVYIEDVTTDNTQDETSSLTKPPYRT